MKKGINSFFRVSCGARFTKEGGFHIETFAQGELQRRIDRFQRHPDGKLSFRDDRACDRLGRRQQIGGWDDLIDEADP